MKILELTNYSAGICGVWNRVKEESIRLHRLGHEVTILSSNHMKGSSELAPREDEIEGVKIKRFPATKVGGESYMVWNFEKDLLALRPEIIIAHSYRHPHTTMASKIAKKINAKCFLVTHAPFSAGNHSLVARIYIKYFHDPLVGRKTLSRFDKIIAITKWEYPYLKNLGVKKEKIEYIPNGIPEEFFSYSRLSKEENKILFFGRVAPIKSLETLIKAVKFIRNKEVQIEIAGPGEEKYLEKLKSFIREEKVENRFVFSGPIYELKAKIKKIDSAKLFILPSKSEAMPQSLIEAMARGKIAIGSDNNGNKDLINNNNGLLFKIRDEKDLADKINQALEQKSDLMKKNAKKSVKQFSWEIVIKKLDKLIQSV